MNKIPIGLPPPPPEIFEFSLPPKHTQDATQRGVRGQGWWYVPDHGEYIAGKGCFEYFQAMEGHPAPALPCIRVPFWDTINLLVPIKRQLSMAFSLIGAKESRTLLVFSLILGKKWRGRLLNKLCEAFNEIAMQSLRYKYLKDDFYSPPVREIIGFCERFLVLLGVRRDNAYRVARTIGMMFENDQAYCWRFQDAMTYATESLKENPWEEIPKLIQVLIDHDPAFEVDPNGWGMKAKYDSISKVLKYMRFIPSIKKAFLNALQPLNISDCQLTENDIYHTLLYGSYNVQGKTPEERLKIYESYHGADQSKWPLRWSLA